MMNFHQLLLIFTSPITIDTMFKSLIGAWEVFECPLTNKEQPEVLLSLNMSGNKYLRVLCYEKRYFIVFKRWWMKNKSQSVYRINTNTNFSFEDNTKAIISEDIYLPDSFVKNYGEGFRVHALTNLYLDIICHRLRLS